MATITITIPNNVANRVQDAICEKYGYTGFLDRDNTIPQTKPEFVKAWIISDIKRAVKDHEAINAIQNVSNDVESLPIT